jgi:hypothetical protein
MKFDIIQWATLVAAAAVMWWLGDLNVHVRAFPLFTAALLALSILVTALIVCAERRRTRMSEGSDKEMDTE